VNQVHDNLVSEPLISAAPKTMSLSLKKSDLPQTLEELVAKVHADFAVQQDLGDLAEGVKLLRSDLNKALKDVTYALAAFKAEFSDLSQQQRAQHVAITRLEHVGRGEPSLVNTNTILQAMAARDRGSCQLQAPLGPADEHTPCLYKLNFPTYDGKENPCFLLTICNIFFLVHRTPKADKMGLALCHLTGTAVR
jgi:ABC-type transporter Mla subunit MlaD